MSVDLLVAATVAKLQTSFSKDGRWIDLAPLDGAPPTSAPSWFLGVYEGPTANLPVDNPATLWERYSVNIAISRRISEVPRDRLRMAYTEVSRAIFELQATTIAALVGWSVPNQANTDYSLGIGLTGSKFVGPLRLRSIGQTRFYDGAWADELADKFAWAVRLLTFEGADRLQNQS